MSTYGNSSYGSLIYASDSADVDEIVGALTPNLMAYLPDYYAEIKDAEEIQGAIAKELGKLRYDIQDVLDQFYVYKATWGLDEWERLIGIKTDYTKPIEQRRSVIISRLRGAGTTTVARLKDVAASFSGGEVEILEYPEEHHFVIKFVGVAGIPPNLNDLTASVEQIKPAHLSFEYMYTYLTWAKATRFTWAGAGGMNWNEIRERVFD